MSDNDSVPIVHRGSHKQRAEQIKSGRAKIRSGCTESAKKSIKINPDELKRCINSKTSG